MFLQVSVLMEFGKFSWTKVVMNSCLEAGGGFGRKPDATKP